MERILLYTAPGITFQICIWAVAPSGTLLVMDHDVSLTMHFGYDQPRTPNVQIYSISTGHGADLGAAMRHCITKRVNQY